MSIRHLIYRLKKLFLPVYDQVLRTCARITQPTSCMEKSWEGEDPNKGSKKVAVFLHFDPKDRVHDYVLHYLNSLNQAGYRILLVSNAKQMQSSSLEKLKPLCWRLYQRKNIGHDFGAFKDGILSIKNRKQLDSLLVVNDSVYGPFTPLGPLLKRADPEIADIWSLTDNWDMHYHLQSFFMLFHKAALNNEKFDTFWKSYPYVNNRNWVVRHGEISLTQSMVAAELKCQALFPYSQIVKTYHEVVSKSGVLKNENLPNNHRDYLIKINQAIEGSVPLNPTHFFWEILIAYMGCPFIKRDLLQKNSQNVPGLYTWAQIIENKSDYDTNLIIRHLQQVMKGRAL